MPGLVISFKQDENGNVEVVTGFDSVKTIRNKGRSLIDFPRDYVVLDLEITGLSPEYDEIIEMSAIRYAGGEKTETFSSLIKPKYEVDEYITELTGITNEMLESAPSIEEKIDEFIRFIGESLIVGYNVNFDINFIYDNLLRIKGKEFKNSYVDVMRIARKALPELPHHRQKDIANYYGINTDGSHRALVDCEICNDCLIKLKETIELSSTLEEFIKSYRNSSGNHKGTSARNIVANEATFNENHPLYGKVCVFTGTLEKMVRKQAMQIVADLGGIPADSVNKKTNFLILGNNDYCKTIKDGKSSKQKKAEKMILDGADLEIIPEQVFYDLVFEAE